MVNSPHVAQAEPELDLIFGALADPTRRAILTQLSGGISTVKELAAPHDISLPAISKHLKVLERAGLLEREVDGRIHRCSLSPEPLKRAQTWIEKQRAFWEERFDALARFLEQSIGEPGADRSSASSSPDSEENEP